VSPGRMLPVSTIPIMTVNGSGAIVSRVILGPVVGSVACLTLEQ
jgi:hypothetical protein